jgi:hypothetical protein
VLRDAQVELFVDLAIGIGERDLESADRRVHELVPTCATKLASSLQYVGASDTSLCPRSGIIASDLLVVPAAAMGRSLGGAAAHELYARPVASMRAVVLESAFCDLRALIRRRGLEPPRTFAPDELSVFDPTEKLRRGTLPVLVLHGARDELIIPDEARVAYMVPPMLLGIVGLLQLRTWGLLVSLASNIAIVILASVGVLNLPHEVRNLFIGSAIAQLIVPLPMLSTILRKRPPNPDAWRRTRAIVPAVIVIVIAAVAVYAYLHHRMVYVMP